MPKASSQVSSQLASQDEIKPPIRRRSTRLSSQQTNQTTRDESSSRSRSRSSSRSPSRSPSPKQAKRGRPRKQQNSPQPKKATGRKAKLPKSSSVSTSRKNKTKGGEKASKAIDQFRKELFGSDDESSGDEARRSSSDDSEESGDSDRENKSSQKMFATVEKLQKQKSLKLPSSTSKTTKAKPVSLFEFITEDSTAKRKEGVNKKTVKNWIARYKQNQRNSACELVNLVIKSSGSNYNISQSIFESADLSAELTKMDKSSFKEDYPLKETKKTVKFTKSYLAFWDTLIELCQNSINFDEYLLPSISAWIIVFSRSNYRQLRHVATMTGLQIVKSLSSIAFTTRTELKQTERLANARKKNTDTSKMKEKVTTLHKEITTMENIMNDLFTGIFKFRNRDKSEIIRALCVQSLGEWMLVYPDVFVSDYYLRYLGWSLSDEKFKCRYNALVAIEKLVDSPHFSKLQNFVKYFEKRLFSMMRDVNPSVSVIAIRLISKLIKNELTDEKNLEIINKLVGDDDVAIRVEAAKYIKSFYLDKKLTSSMKISGETDNQTYLRFFVDYVKKIQISETIEHLIDSLWDPSLWPAPKRSKKQSDADEFDHIYLRDWKAMTDLLKNDTEISADELCILANICSISVKKAVGSDLFPHHRGDKQTKEKPNKIEENRQKITEHFVVELPGLIASFIGDPKILNHLLDIPVHFDLSVLSEERLFESFVQLIESTKALFLQRGEKDIILKAAKAFQHFLKPENPFLERTVIILSVLIDNLQDKFLENYDLILASDKKEREKSQKNIANALTGIRYLFAIRNFESLSLSDKLIEILSLPIKKQSSTLLPEILEESLEVLSTNILWKFSKLSKNENVTNDEIDDFKLLKNNFFYSLEFYLQYPNSSDLQYYSFLKLLDFFVLFSAPLLKTKLRSLYSPLGAILSDKLLEYFLHVLSLPTDDVDNKEKIMEKKEKVLVGVARATSLLVLPIDEFAHLIYLQLNKFNKKIDEIICFFYRQIRDKHHKYAKNISEGTIILKAINHKYREYLQNPSNESLESFYNFTKSIGLTFPIRSDVHQTTLSIIMKGCFVTAVSNFPHNLQLLSGLPTLLSKLLPNRVHSLLEHCEKVLEEEYIKLNKNDKTHQIAIDFVQSLKGEKKFRKTSLKNPQSKTDEVGEGEEENDDSQMEVSTQELRKLVSTRSTRKRKLAENLDNRPTKKTKEDEEEEDNAMASDSDNSSIRSDVE